MKFLRWIGLTLAVAAFSFFLWIFALDLGIVHVANHPITVKNILSDSGIYNNVLTTALNQKDDQGNPTTIKIDGDEVATNDPIILSAANKALPPSLIQQNVNQVIDSFNAWANGQSAKPDFKVDLSGPKAAFAQDVASQLQTKLSALPACTDGTTAETFNPFTGSCLPKGLTAAAAASAVQSDLANSKEFLRNPVYTANDLKDSNNQPVFNNPNVNNGREHYNRIKTSPVFLAAMALIMALAVLFLSSTRRRGVRRIGIVLLLNGLIIMGFTALINAGINRVTPSDNNPNVKSFEESGIKAGRSLVHDLNRIYYPLSGAYAGLGAVMIIGSLVIKRGGKDAKTAGEPTMHKPTILDETDGPTPDKELEPESEPNSEPEPSDEPKPEPKPAAKPKPSAKPKKAAVKIKVS